MNENLKAFFQKASEDSELQDKLNNLYESMFNEAKKRFINFAEENGFTITEADIDDLYAENGEAGEDELKTVTAGSYTQKHKDGRFMSGCFCSFGGGGSSDQYQKTCACVLGGCGELTDYGKEKVSAGDIHYTGKGGKPVAMWCALSGSGGLHY